VRLGRRDQISVLLAAQPVSELPPAPQWQVLRRITTAEGRLALGESDAAMAELHQAIPAATTGHLPQQLVRIIRVLEPCRRDPVARAIGDTAHARLDQLARQTALASNRPQ